MRAKRGIDIVVGSILALLALPLVLVLALGCAISLRAWPLFIQRRVGRGGRVFPLPKLRTLPPSTNDDADKYEVADVWTPAFCRFLRRTHLDELPQLFVVPLGWMSLVGPRPETPGQLAHYPADFVAVRTSVRPGCTGLWQVGTATELLIYEAPEYDVAYVERSGLRLDVWIMLRTLRSLTNAPGCALEDVPAWVWARPATIDLAAAERADAPIALEPDVAAEAAS
jgi:lipopolysaccharide/colanic/teichoic acid biosynthesis glycosyltransferase